MKLELIIASISLIASIILGIIQIKISKEQKSIKTKITQFEIGKANIRGIVGNSNKGDIKNNIL